MSMSSQPRPAGAVACRCCPGGISRSTRARRYPSDMTEAEWAVCEPLLPAPAWLAGRGGRPASRCMRDIVDAIRYLTHNGPVWRALPADFPPAGPSTGGRINGRPTASTERMHDDLRDRVRVAAGRSPPPTAAIIDSQSVKGSEMIARTRRGYDAGKKINGTKRHIAVDTLGLLLTVLVTAASVQDRDAARPLLWNLRRAFPSIKLAWADGGYAGKLVTWAKTRLQAHRWRSSSDPMTCTPSRSCPAGGWWSGRCRGSPATAAPSATTSACPPTTKPTSTGP